AAKWARACAPWTGRRRRSVPPTRGHRASAVRSACCCRRRRRSSFSGVPSSSPFTTTPTVPSSGPIRAIAVTAYTTLRERQEALAAGFDAHLAKPLDPDQLWPRLPPPSARKRRARVELVEAAIRSVESTGVSRARRARHAELRRRPPATQRRGTGCPQFRR